MRPSIEEVAARQRAIDEVHVAEENFSKALTEGDWLMGLIVLRNRLEAAYLITQKQLIQYSEGL